MRKCDNCGVKANIADLHIDHILPRSHKDYNALENLRAVHSRCNKKPSLWRRIMRRIGYWRYKLVMWLDRIGGKNV